MRLVVKLNFRATLDWARLIASSDLVSTDVVMTQADEYTKDTGRQTRRPKMTDASNQEENETDTGTLEGQTMGPRRIDGAFRKTVREPRSIRKNSGEQTLGPRRTNTGPKRTVSGGRKIYRCNKC